VPQGAVQAEFRQKFKPVQMLRGHLLGGGQQASGDGQVKAAALLGQVRRRQVHHHAPLGKAEMVVLDGAAHPVAGLAAQELLDRDARGFAGDVPQRVVNAGDGRQADPARWKAKLLVQFHHDIFNAARIIALKHFEDVVSNRCNREIWPRGVGFTPSVEPLVCFDFNEAAGPIAEACHKGFDSGNFHVFYLVLRLGQNGERHVWQTF